MPQLTMVPNDEERQSLLSSESPVENEPKKKFFTPWAIASLAVVVICSTLLFVNTGKSAETTDLVKKAGGFVLKSAGKKVKQAVKTTYSKLSHKEHGELFSQFKKSHGKQYSSDEDSYRFEHFKTNLALIDERNAAEVAVGGYAMHGVTKYSDLSPEEFKKRYLTYRKEQKTQASKILHRGPHKGAPYRGDATYVDWSETLTTGVRDQGYCGSCWAFSATEQLESDSIRAGYLTTSDLLSPQQVVSCDSYDYGCEGGNTETAYMYIARAGGLYSDSDYPYTSYWAVTGSCKTSKMSSKKQLVTVTGYVTINDESAMETYVLSTGPLSVCLDASKWSSYTSGIVSSCGYNIDHCVQVVGLDTEASSWKLRNSWGTDWGESGYIYLKSGVDMCGITTDPTYVTVAQS